MKRFWWGYVVVEIKNVSGEEFINVCRSEGIILYDLYKTPAGLKVRITSKDTRHLLKLVRKIGGKSKILSKGGAIFPLLRLQRREGLLLGLAICLAIIYLSLGYIWSYEVSGNERYSKEEIVQIVENYGAKIGMGKNDVDLERITKEILKDYNGDLAWLWLGTKGTVLEIKVKEMDESFLDYDTTADLVAAKNGIISNILVLDGTAKVKVGEMVYQGEVLIQGVEYDNWQKNELGIYEPADSGRGIRAQGQVKGIVDYELIGICSLNEHYFQANGESEMDYCLQKNRQTVFSTYKEAPIALQKVLWRKEIKIGADLWSLCKIESKNQHLQQREYELAEAYENSIHRAENAMAKAGIIYEQITNQQSELIFTGNPNVIGVKLLLQVEEDLTQVQYR